MRKRILAGIVAVAVIFGDISSCPKHNIERHKSATEIKSGRMNLYVSKDSRYELTLPDGWVEIIDIGRNREIKKTSFCRLEDITAGNNFLWPMVEIQEYPAYNKDFSKIALNIDRAIRSNINYAEFTLQGKDLTDGICHFLYSSPNQKKLLVARVIDADFTYILLGNLNNNERDINEVFDIIDSFRLR